MEYGGIPQRFVNMISSLAMVSAKHMVILIDLYNNHTALIMAHIEDAGTLK